MSKKTTNGHAATHALAEAFAGVVEGAVTRAVKPIDEKVETIITEMGEMESRLVGKIEATEDRLNKRIDTTNQNVQSQLDTELRARRKEIAGVKKDIKDLRQVIQGG